VFCDDGLFSQEIEKISPTVGWRPTRSILNELLTSYGKWINETEKQMVIQLADLIEKCTALEPNKRITPEEALKHPLFLSNKKKLIESSIVSGITRANAPPQITTSPKMQSHLTKTSALFQITTRDYHAFSQHQIHCVTMRTSR
jgi:serine/threonine protein kinase